MAIGELIACGPVVRQLEAIQLPIAESWAIAGQLCRHSVLLYERRRDIAAFGIAFAAILAVALIQSAKLFYYDSGVYWQLGESFVVHGHFSLLNFNSPLRGYLLPLVDHGLQEVARSLDWNYSTPAKVLNVLTVSSIGAVLAPRLAEIAWPGYHWGIGRRLLLTAFLVVFWHGFLDFPLSTFRHSRQP